MKLNIKAGAEAKSYDDVAKAEKLKPLELTLRKLEDLTNEIATAFQHLKERETQHRDTNGEAGEER